jgi:hypothetical protein
MKEYFDPGSVLIIIITFVLFVVALFVKGFTKDLLLEAGVFLVSMKLIIMAYKNGIYMKTLEQELKQIKILLGKRQEA